MNSASSIDTTAGRPGQPRSRVRTILNTLSKQWLYIGFAIFLATLNLLLGILTLSYLHPKKEALLFGIVCFGILIALGHFASLCYLIQRAKNEYSDPTMLDALYAFGVIILFAISGAALTVELPSRCFSGPNEHFKVIGKNCCMAVTAMAVSSWLAVIIMIIAAIIIFVAARRAIELAKLPPPVFPSGAEAPVMRWLDRNDPFREILLRSR
ncbi:hypothetical protein BDN70DRAFT_118253 [Pholiota conissans]|uniref:MARVEL domain-containing protein n=1 Tax=Pholiota conissans TaxID=109636 RepID=A0A9P5YY54_9AGAR|nr:hypothetical protein BDN70DRAFT_118253 [Pholiota conissans]